KLKYKDFTSTLTGNYQLKNIATMLTAIDELNNLGFDLSEKIIRGGIENLPTNAPLMGRWQKLGEKPLIIADTGHNEDGLKYIIEQIAQTPYENLHFVLGMVDDKDVDKVLSMLPNHAHYYLCK